MDGERAKRDRALSEIAERQHGVVSIGQLRAIGVSEDAAASRARAGRLHRIHRGVYGVGHPARSNEALWTAAVLACGMATGAAHNGVVAEGCASAGHRGSDAHDLDLPTMSMLEYWGAALSHLSAAQLWGLLPCSEGPADVSVPGDGGRAKRSGIRLHRSLTLLPASVTLRRGIPVTTPAGTISDLRRVSKGASRLISAPELRRAVRQANVLRLPLDEGDRRDRTRSDLERDFLRLCRRYGLPAPEVNVRVGPYLVDFLWRAARVVVETDGYAYHRGRAAFEDDRGRDLDLRARGFDVIHLSGKQIDKEPRQVVAVVGAGLRVGANRWRLTLPPSPSSS